MIRRTSNLYLWIKRRRANSASQTKTAPYEPASWIKTSLVHAVDPVHAVMLGGYLPELVAVEPTNGALGPCLVWRFAEPLLAISSSIVGGGIVNAVATITEAKVQALLERQVLGTGTASDALCILCPLVGDAETFGGPRSTWGARLALATYDAVAAGIVRQRG